LSGPALAQVDAVVGTGAGPGRRRCRERRWPRTTPLSGPALAQEKRNQWELKYLNLPKMANRRQQRVSCVTRFSFRHDPLPESAYFFTKQILFNDIHSVNDTIDFLSDRLAYTIKFEGVASSVNGFW
jgi:hypothetical protein